MNNPPLVANTVPDQTLEVGGSSFTRDLNASPLIFNDPDGDTLTYTASSSDSNTATATISGSIIEISPMNEGNAMMTVTANDGKGGSQSTSFTVTVAVATGNRAPVLANALLAQVLAKGGASFIRDLNASPFVFNDADGDAMNYTAISSAPNMAAVIMSISTLTVAPIDVGSATITITAYDNKGGSELANLNVTIIENQPPQISHSPLSLESADQEFIIAANITDDLGIASAELNYRRGGDNSFTELSMSESTGSFQAKIPASAVTSRGVEYYIKAEDLAGLLVREPSSGIHSVQILKSDLGEVRDTAQPGGSEQTAYRLISVPLDVDNKSPSAVLEDDLGEYDITQWRFYEVPANQIKVQFPDTSPMSSGKGFWLIVRNQGKRISTGAGTSNPTGSDFAMSLHPQWNLIGNPFNFPIPVSNLSLSNSQSVELRSYTGSWNDLVNNPVSTIQPFGGYALFNSSSTNTTLSVNPEISSGETAVAKGPSAQMNWSLQIVAQSQAAVDRDNFLGLSSRASKSWDELDRPEPPVIGEFVSVYFPHPEWSELSENYCTDFRPEIAEGEIWEFEVMTNIRDVVNLSFEGVKTVPNDYQVWLVDPLLQTSQNLRRKDRYSVAASVEHPKRLQLLIGRTDFVEENLLVTENIPESFELSQNFPNPFNPTTTIRYGLPQEERVTLKVYNILGEEVVTLVNDELKTAGFHVAVWDGRNSNGQRVGSGVYLYQVRFENGVETKKMALVR